jgi:hypothetical protein
MTMLFDRFASASAQNQAFRRRPVERQKENAGHHASDDDAIATGRTKRLPAYLFLDPVESGDPIQQVARQRRLACCVVLEYLAAKMRPTGDFLDAVAPVELVETS